MSNQHSNIHGGGVLTTTMVFLREKNGTTVPGILKDEDVEKRVVVGK